VAPPSARGWLELELDTYPTRTLARGVVGRRRETKAGMEMARYEPGRPQDAIRGPAVTVEDPDAIADDAAGRMDLYLPREMSGQSDVVVPEHDLDPGAFREDVSEEVEHDRA
jgi:hypothetical protein